MVEMNELLRSVSDVEKHGIASYINDYAENGLMVDVDTILTPWAEAKRQLFEMFNHQLILSKPITYEEDPDRIEGKINEYIHWGKGTAFMLKFVETVLIAICKYNDLNTLHCSQGTIRNFCESLFYSHVLANNKYENDYLFSNLDANRFDFYITPTKKISVMPGAHPLRIVSKIVREIMPEEIDAFEEFRIAISQFTNQKRLNGTLNLSIHPLDYMTMSDNECGWSSCMSWYEHGCYRAGTVEMMNSPVVVVAYVTSNDRMQIDQNLDWNSKKWRQLFIVDPRCLVSIKSYPYFNEELTKTALDWLKELATNYGWCDYATTMDTFKNGRYNEYRFYTNAMYNDFGSTTHFIYPTCDDVVVIDYSGVRECMRCGSINGDYTIAEENCGSLCCDDCWEGDIPYEYCVCCGRRICDDEQMWVDDEIYCPQCYDKYFVEDMITNRSIDKDDALKIVIPQINYYEWDPCEHIYTSKLICSDKNIVRYIADDSKYISDPIENDDGKLISFKINDIPFVADFSINAYRCEYNEISADTFGKLISATLYNYF